MGHSSAAVTSSYAGTALTVGYPPSSAHQMAQRTSQPLSSLGGKTGLEASKALPYGSSHAGAYVTGYPAYGTPIRGRSGVFVPS